MLSSDGNNGFTKSERSKTQGTTSATMDFIYIYQLHFIFVHHLQEDLSLKPHFPA